MFSKFLATKDSDDVEEENQPASPTIILKKKINFMNCSLSSLNILMKSDDSKTRAAESILMSLRH